MSDFEIYYNPNNSAELVRSNISFESIQDEQKHI